MGKEKRRSPESSKKHHKKKDQPRKKARLRTGWRVDISKRTGDPFYTFTPLQHTQSRRPTDREQRRLRDEYLKQKEQSVITNGKENEMPGACTLPDGENGRELDTNEIGSATCTALLGQKRGRDPSVMTHIGEQKQIYLNNLRYKSEALMNYLHAVLFMRGIHTAIDDAYLRTTLSDCDFVRAYIFRDGGISKGCCTVTCASWDGAAKVMKMLHGKELFGRTVSVELSQPGAQRTSVTRDSRAGAPSSSFPVPDSSDFVLGSLGPPPSRQDVLNGDATIKSRDVQIERLTTSTRELNLLVSGGRDEAKKASKREIEAALTDQEKKHREQLATALADQEEKHNEDLAEMQDRHNRSLNVRSSEEAELQQRRLREYEDRLNDCLEKLDQHDMAAKEASAAHCRQVAELEAQHSAAIANLESRLAELAQDHSRRVGELELHYAENNAAMKSQNAQERDSAESMYANAMETAELKLRHANETAEKRLHQAKADYDRKIQEMRRDLTLQHRTEVETLQKGHAEEKGIRKTVEQELDAFKGRNDDLATEVARLKEDLNQRDDMLKIARKQSEYDRLRNEKRLKDMEDRGGVHPLDCNGVLFGNDCGTKLAIEEVMRYLGWWHVATIGSGERKVSGEILVYVKPSKKAAVLVHRAFCVLAGPTDDNSLDRIIVRSMSASMVRQVLVEVCDLSDVEPAKCLHPDFVSDEEAEEIFCPFLFGLYNFEHAHRGLHYHKIHSVAFVRNTLAGIDLNCLTENNFPKSPKGAPMTHLARIHWRRLLQQDQKPEGIISDGTISAVECIDDNGGGSDDNALEEALNGYMYDFVGTDGMSAAEGYAADETFRLVDKAINILVKANSEAGQIHTAVRNVDGMLVKNRDHYWRRIRQYFDTESDFWGKVEDGIELLRFTDEHGKRIYHEVSPPLDQAELQQRKKHKKSTGFSIAQRQDVDAMLEHGKKKWFFIRGAGKEQIPVPDSVQKFIIQHQNRQDLEQPSIPVFDTWTVKGLRKNLGKRRKDNSNFTTTFQHVKGKTPPGGGQRTNVIMDGYALVFLCDSSENTKKMYLT